MGPLVSSSSSSSSTSPEVHAGVSCGRSALGTGGESESSAAALPVNETSLDDDSLEDEVSREGRGAAGSRGGPAAAAAQACELKLPPLPSRLPSVSSLSRPRQPDARWGATRALALRPSGHAAAPAAAYGDGPIDDALASSGGGAMPCAHDGEGGTL